MRITYISNSRIPTEKAYGVSVVKTCEALVGQKGNVTLCIPRVRNLTGSDLFSYYGIKKNFSVRHIPTIDAVKLGWKYSFLVNQISFGIATFFLYSGNKDKDVVITRDEVSGWLLSLMGHRVFYDIHGFPESRLWAWKILLKHITGIFATNEWKARQCHNTLGISKEKIIVARNGFDPKNFFVHPVRSSRGALNPASVNFLRSSPRQIAEHPTSNGVHESVPVLRKQLNMPADKPVVLYVGHLYDWKGVYVLAEAARMLPNVNFIFVGGTYYNRAEFEEKYASVQNIILVGQKPHEEIPLYLKSADVLALPNSGAPGRDPRLQIYSQKDTSPIKMFEYMASGVPIVASKLPSIQEVLNEKNAILVQPDSPNDLKQGIERILNDKRLANDISEQALEDVKEYTWDKRAEKILNFVKEKSG